MIENKNDEHKIPNKYRHTTDSLTTLHNVYEKT